MKIIDYILDRYYTKKLFKLLEISTHKHLINTKIIYEKGYYKIYAKKPKYNDNEYKLLFATNIFNGLYYFIKIDELGKSIDLKIKELLGE